MSEFPKIETAIHCHDSYSAADATMTTEELVLAAKKQGMKAVSLTNHGNMCSIMEFTDLCKKHDIAPIIGSEMYFAKPGSEKERTSNHLLVVVKNQIGYDNMLKLQYLSSIPVDEGGGYHAKPRITEKILFEHAEGLLVSSSCLASSFSQYILNGEFHNAVLMAERFKENTELHLEWMPHDIPEQKIYNQALLEISKKLNLPIIISFDAHYKDADSHDSYKLYVSGNRKTNEEMYAENEEDNKENDWLPEKNLWLRPTDDVVRALLSHDLPKEEIIKAIENTNRYAEKISFDFVRPKFGLPHISDNAKDDLKKLVVQGLYNKFGNDIPRQYIDRAKYELKVIYQLGYCDYFLILFDALQHYKNNIGGILGPGRGSACGSLILWLLDITAVDSVAAKLPFERFLSPDRISPPDVDADVQPKYRDALKDYLRQKYGQDRVVEVINFNRIKPKSAISDVCRAKKISFEETKEITKKIPMNTEDETGEEHTTTIEDVIHMPQFQEYIQKYPEVFETAKQLNGAIRSYGKHAAAVCVLPKSIYECIPVTRRNDTIISQWDKVQLESIGIQKFDILGLSSLEIIDMCQRQTGIQTKNIPLDDNTTWEFIQKASSMELVFQLSSFMMKKLIKEVCPSSIDELTHINALCRPGTLDNNLHLEYIKNKKQGYFDFPFDVPEAREIVSETHGIVLFQEQVIYLANRVAGLSLGVGDLMRRAMEKYGTISKRTEKVISEYNKYKNLFIDGMISKGYSVEVSNDLFDWLSNSVGYSFSINHSYPYSLLGYYTAFYKSNYPEIFYTICLNLEDNKGKKDKNDVTQFDKLIVEAKKTGIKLYKPTFKHNYTECTVISEKEIALGLSMLKGMTKKACRHLERKFNTVDEWIYWFVRSDLDKKHIKALLGIHYFESEMSNEQVWELYQTKLWEYNNELKKSEWEEKKAAGRKVHPFSPNKYKPEPMEVPTEEEVLGFQLETKLDKIMLTLPEKYHEEPYLVGMVKSQKSGKSKWGTWRMVNLETSYGPESLFLKDNVVFSKNDVLLVRYTVSRKGAKSIEKFKVLEQ